MAKIRAVVVEMEGTDGTVLDAIRTFVNVGGVQLTAAAPAAAPMKIAPVEAAQQIEAAPALPAAPKVKRVIGRRKKAAAAVVSSAPVEVKPEVKAEVKAGPVAKEDAKEPTCRQQVYAALKAGPKTSEALIKEFPKYTPSSIYLALKDLRLAMVVRSTLVGGEQKNERIG